MSSIGTNVTKEHGQQGQGKAKEFALPSLECKCLQVTNTWLTQLAKLQVIKFNNIVLRQVFSHPGFKFPILYNDIAVAELGKLILFPAITAILMVSTLNLADKSADSNI